MERVESGRVQGRKERPLHFIKNPSSTIIKNIRKSCKLLHQMNTSKVERSMTRAERRTLSREKQRTREIKCFVVHGEQ